MHLVIFKDGDWLNADDASVSVFDGGWLHGAGLFETMRAEFGTVFRLDAHLDRLMNSADKLLIPIERPDLPLTTDFEALLRRNELPEARVRMTVTSGRVDNHEQSDDRPKLTVIVTAAPLTGYPPELYERGLSVVISRYRQNPDDPLTGHKSTSYLSRLVALREAQQSQCGEALWFTTQNLLAEGCLSNVFVVKDGKLHTPPLSTPVLPGIARAVVVEIAGEQSIELAQRPLTIDELLDADEVLLTNSIMQVLPVCRVERKNIGTGKPGEMARQLAEHYRKKVATECRPDV